jgi:membrane associated rhomboid family serine protease
MGHGYANCEVPTCYRHPDRETGLSCSECGRPICTDCVTFAPVGLRCPDHATTSGRAPRSTPTAVRSVQRPLARRGIVIPSHALVTRILIALNVIVYLVTVAQGSGLNNPGGSLFDKWILFGPFVHHGDWWRLITATFLHASVWHIAFNMYALWWLGSVIEGAIGSARFVLLYLVSGLTGSAGALLLDPTKPVVGASGAIFGILGAGLILEWRASGRLIGGFAVMLLINLAITFGFRSFISVGGHVGGLLGGVIGTAIIVARARYRSTWDVPTILGLVAIGVGSVVIAYLKVRNLA